MGEDQVGGECRARQGCKGRQLLLSPHQAPERQGNSLHAKPVKESTNCTHNTQWISGTCFTAMGQDSEEEHAEHWAWLQVARPVPEVQRD